ncbi:MAG TPA: protein kinase, partial [Blastocatellia bacterium]|nr:protein kinase [Blastocatellia bacterium]
AVFKGIDLMLEREVAIKMLRPELASQPQVVERFRAEAVTLAKLNHPNIATLYSFLRQGEDFFMVMEFVRGVTLDEAIRRTGAMAFERAVPLLCQALEGIDHAHRMGIIHRDIKPANMMITESGSIKVMDFGIARVLGSARMTRQGSIVGTIEYMSPEQVRGQESDARSDIYSLGILLYEMLTGRVPFSSDSEFDLMKAQIEEAPAPPRTFAAHIPLPVEQAIMRALAKRPEARYQTAGEFRAMLLSTLGSVTNSLNASPAYAAPATRMMEPVGGHTSAEAPKETRLPSKQGASAAAGGQIKETRLGQTSDVQVMSAQATAPNIGGHTQPSRPQPSLLGALNWKHYAGAGAALVAIVAIPLALIGGGDRSASTQNPAPAQAPVSQPAPVQPPAPSAPPTGQTAAPAATGQPVIPPGSQLGEIPAEKPVNPTPDAPRPARTRESRGDKSAQAQQPAATEPAQTAPTPPPQRTQPPAPPKEERAAAKEPEKKDESKTEDKVKKKIGGFFKKINPFGGDKKKDEKKP